MDNRVAIDRLTWQEYAARVKENPVLVVPVGSLEQHGPHLPLGVDVMISYNLALRLAAEIGGLVAPPINYGYKSHPASGGGPIFPGTTGLNGITLINLIYDILAEFIDDGFKKILILNGHFENDAFLLEAIDLVLKQYPKRKVKILMGSWYDQISPKTLDVVFDEVPFPGWALEHAAIAETSLMMYFAPDLVHLERSTDAGIETPPTYHIYPVPLDIVPPSGQLHTPRSSSPEKGKIMVEDIVSAYKEIVMKEFDV